MKFDYKERKDTAWALRMFAAVLDEHAGSSKELVEARQSAKRLRKLAARVENER
jgi:hypothetical protein